MLYKSHVLRNPPVYSFFEVSHVPNSIKFANYFCLTVKIYSFGWNRHLSAPLLHFLSDFKRKPKNMTYLPIIKISVESTWKNCIHLFSYTIFITFIYLSYFYRNLKEIFTTKNQSCIFICFFLFFFHKSFH